MEETTFVCSHCGAVRPISERYQICGEDVCESCVSNDTVLCDECGTRTWRADAVRDDYTTLCTCCFEHSYTRCVECGSIISNETAHINNNEPYCEGCWNQRETENPIHTYSYKPYPIFYGDGPRYLGVELEIDGAGEDEYSAKHILGAANSDTEHLYIKRDGSLDDGLELVTYRWRITKNRCRGTGFWMKPVHWATSATKPRLADCTYISRAIRSVIRG